MKYQPLRIDKMLVENVLYFYVATSQQTDPALIYQAWNSHAVLSDYPRPSENRIRYLLKSFRMELQGGKNGKIQKNQVEHQAGAIC